MSAIKPPPGIHIPPDAINKFAERTRLGARKRKEYEGKRRKIKPVKFNRTAPCHYCGQKITGTVYDSGHWQRCPKIVCPQKCSFWLCDKNCEHVEWDNSVYDYYAGIKQRERNQPGRFTAFYEEREEKPDSDDELELVSIF